MPELRVFFDDSESYVVCPHCKSKIIMAQRTTYQENRPGSKKLFVIDIVSWLVLGEGLFYLLMYYYSFNTVIKSPNVLIGTSLVFACLWSVLSMVIAITAVGLQRLQSWAKYTYVAIIVVRIVLVIVVNQFVVQPPQKPSVEQMSILFTHMGFAVFMLIFGRNHG